MYDKRKKKDLENEGKAAKTETRTRNERRAQLGLPKAESDEVLTPSPS